MMMNMRMKLTTNSKAKAWPWLTEGTVTSPDMKELKRALRVKDAEIDAKTWTAT